MELLSNSLAPVAFPLMLISLSCCIAAVLKLSYVDNFFIGIHVLGFASYSLSLPEGIYEFSGLAVIWVFAWSVGGLICSAALVFGRIIKWHSY